MKFVKAIKFLASLAVILFPAMLVSCNDDDDSEPTPPQVVFDPNNACYTGIMESTVSMPNMPAVTYQTKDSKWNFVIDTKKNTCTVKLIDARFSEKMPTMLLHLRDLKYDSRMQTVKGTDITPYVQEGDGMTPNDRFKFSKFEAIFADKAHSGVNVTFEVANMGTGKFTSTGIFL